MTSTCIYIYIYIHIYPVKLTRDPHHAHYGLQQFVTRNIHPGHLYGIRVTGGARGQEVIHRHGVVTARRAAHLRSRTQKQAFSSAVQGHVMLFQGCYYALLQSLDVVLGGALEHVLMLGGLKTKFISNNLHITIPLYPAGHKRLD